MIQQNANKNKMEILCDVKLFGLCVCCIFIWIWNWICNQWTDLLDSNWSHDGLTTCNDEQFLNFFTRNNSTSDQTENVTSRPLVLARLLHVPDCELPSTKLHNLPHICHTIIEIHTKPSQQKYVSKMHYNDRNMTINCHNRLLANYAWLRTT